MKRMGDISISEISTFAHKYLLISAQFLIEFQKKIIKLRKKYLITSMDSNSKNLPLMLAARTQVTL